MAVSRTLPCTTCWGYISAEIHTKAVKFLWKSSDNPGHINWGLWRAWHQALTQSAKSAGLWAGTCKPSCDGLHKSTKAPVSSAIMFVVSMNYVWCLMQMMMSDATGTFQFAHKNLFVFFGPPLFFAKSVTTIHTDPFNSFLSIFKSTPAPSPPAVHPHFLIVKSNFKAKKSINNIHWLLTLHCFFKLE